MADPKNDVVFPLSLTEIAFTLVLLLVMLLGILLLHKQQSLEETQRALQSCQRQNYGGACAPDPGSKWIDPMMPCAKCISTVTDLSREESRQVIEIGKKALESWKKAHPKEGVDSDAFLKFKQSVVSDAKAIAEGHDVLRLEGDAEARMRKLEKELADCRASRESDSEKLEYYKTRAGIDVPPCWLKNNRPQYLFEITLLPGQRMQLERAWPEERQAQVDQMPAIAQLLPRFGQPMPISEFMPYEEQILRYSNTADNGQACRYFVRLRNRIPDTQSAIKARHQIEHALYKFELR